MQTNHRLPLNKFKPIAQFPQKKKKNQIDYHQNKVLNSVTEFQTIISLNLKQLKHKPTSCIFLAKTYITTLKFEFHEFFKCKENTKIIRN